MLVKAYKLTDRLQRALFFIFFPIHPVVEAKQLQRQFFWVPLSASSIRVQLC